MPVLTKPPSEPPALSAETDLLMQNLIASLNLARSIKMPLLEQLLEMALIDFGHTVAAQEKNERDRGLN